jgi:hypothetical protein
MLYGDFNRNSLSRLQIMDHKSKKFSCNPKTCNALSGWLRKHSPQLYSDPLQMQVQLPEPATQYIV